MLKNYNSLDIILTLKRHYKLFIASFVVSLAFMLPFVSHNINSINKQIEAQNKSNAELLEQIANEKEGRFSKRKAYFKVHKCNLANASFVIPDGNITNILSKSNRLIDSYKKIFSHQYFDIWEITIRDFKDDEEFGESYQVHLKEIVSFLNESPITANLRNDAKTLQQSLKEKNQFLQRIIDDGFVVLLDEGDSALLGKESHYKNIPINRYYIHLDKHRIAYNQGYTVTSSQIISANIQTHGRKIYVFAVIACVLVSFFAVFFYDCFNRLLKLARKKG